MVYSPANMLSESSWQVLCVVSSISGMLSDLSQLAIKEGNPYIYINLQQNENENVVVTQNLPDNTSTMSVRPAFNRALSDLGPRVDISHKIRGNMLREQDWSTNAGQAFQLMRAAPFLPVVEMVGDIAIYRPRNQEPGSGYLGYYHKKARDLPTNNQLPENPATAVDLVRENIQTVSDSIEQALANEGIRHKPIVNLPPPNPQSPNDPRPFWTPSKGTKQHLFASAEAFLDQKWVPQKGTPKKGTFWRNNGQWRCVSSRFLTDRMSG